AEGRGADPGGRLQPQLLGGLFFPLADRPPAVATGGEGQPAASVGAAARAAHGGGGVRVVKEHGAAAAGEPALPPLGGRGVRRGGGGPDADPAEQQLGSGGGQVGSRCSRAVRRQGGRGYSTRARACAPGAPGAVLPPFPRPLPRPQPSRRPPISQGCFFAPAGACTDEFGYNDPYRGLTPSASPEGFASGGGLDEEGPTMQPQHPQDAE